MNAEMRKKKNKDFLFWLTLVLGVVLVVVFRIYFLDWVQIEGESMLPTLRDGELVIVEKTIKSIEQLNRGDMAVINYPDGTQCIKRIIAIEGDVISIQDSQVILNGEILIEPYINNSNMLDFEEITVEEGTVFVMGDNRGQSRDSRDISVGLISEDQIVGRVKI